MGLLDKILDVAVPATVGYFTGGGPAGSFAGAVKGAEASKAARKQTRLIEQSQAEQRRINQMEFRDTDILSRSTGGIIQQPPRTVNAGFGGGFGSFLGDIGNNILGPLGGLFSQVRPFISGQSQGQPALPTRSNLGGQESSNSGVSEAFVGGLPNFFTQAAKILRTPAGQIGTGLVGGIGANMLAGSGGGMRITRKMKSQYRAVLNLAGGNYDQAAAMIGVSTDMFIMVLLKRFRNDGPVVTKAALRKTKTTVRRLKSMCDMYDSLRPAATRRRAPMKRATTTLIKN